jgi:hypothetical protein
VSRTHKECTLDTNGIRPPNVQKPPHLETMRHALRSSGRANSQCMVCSICWLSRAAAFGAIFAIPIFDPACFSAWVDTADRRLDAANRGRVECRQQVRIATGRLPPRITPTRQDCAKRASSHYPRPRAAEARDSAATATVSQVSRASQSAPFSSLGPQTVVGSVA